MRQSKSSMEVARAVNWRLEQCLQHRAASLGEWMTNLHYAAGKQWIYWDKQNQRIVEMPRDNPWDVRLSVPMIPGLLRQVVAQLLRDRPQWVTSPTSGGPSGQLAARGWNKYLEDLWQRNNVTRMLRDHILPAMLSCATSYLRVTWDPDAQDKRKFVVPKGPGREAEAPAAAGDRFGENILRFPGTEGQSPFGEETTSDGAVVFRPYTALQAFGDPHAIHHDQMQWFLETAYVPVSDVESHYGLKRGTLQRDMGGGYASPGYFEQLIDGLKGVGESIFDTVLGNNKEMDKQTGTYDDGMALVKTMWLAPTQKYPEGRKIVVANDFWLNRDNPVNPYGVIPVVPFRCMPIPGTNVSVALTSLGRGLEMARNRVFSQMIQNMENFNRPQWIVEHGSIISPRMFSNEPNLVSYYKHNPAAPNLKPQRLDPPNVTANFPTVFALIQQMQDEIFALSPASRGKNPAGTRSAESLREQQGSDDERRMPLHDSTNDSLTDVGRLVMHITKRFVREDRLVRIMGEGNEVLVHEFTKADVDEGYDVIVRGTGNLPKSWAAKANVIIQMLGQGLIKTDDPRERREVLQMLEFGNIAALWDDGDERERYRIHTENVSMLTGEEQEVKVQDLHERHLEGHRRWMRSGRYENTLAKLDPSEAQRIRQLHEAHSDTHYEWIAASQGQQPMDQASPAAGGIPGAGSSQSAQAALGSPPGAAAGVGP